MLLIFGQQCLLGWKFQIFAVLLVSCVAVNSNASVRDHTDESFSGNFPEEFFYLNHNGIKDGGLFDILNTKTNDISPAAEQTDDEFAEELLYFFNKGDEEIELYDDEREIVLVVGWSGVGKSTLTLIVAGNQDNPLSVNCLPDTRECYILDEQGLISNQTLISKTLLPNLAIEKDTIPHTALYDCPGFGDTRNASVEIANAYFIQKVASHGEKVKILLVALHNHFMDSERSRNAELIRNVIQIVKNVTHFAEGFGIIGNIMSDSNLDASTISARYISHLGKVKESINRDEDGMDFSEDEKYEANILLDTLIANKARIGYIPSPLPNNMSGPFELYPNLMEARANVKNLIWNEMKYITPMGNDFGFSVSAKAQLKIKVVMQKLNKRIESEIQNISAATLLSLSSMYEELSIGNINNLDLLSQRVSSLMEVRYPNFTEEMEYKAFMENLISNAVTFLDENQKVNLEKLQKLSEYITFLHSIIDGSDDITPSTWVSNFEEIKHNLVDYVSNVLATTIKENNYNILSNFTNKLLSEMLNKVSMKPDINDQFEELNTFYSNVQDIEKELQNYYLNISTAKLSGYLNLTTNLNNLTLPEYGTLLNFTQEINILEVMEVVGWDSWKTGYGWTTPITEMSTVVNDRKTAITFLNSLFKELSKSEVQVKRVGNLHEWRLSSPVTTSADIESMVKKFKSANINVVEGAESALKHIEEDQDLLSQLNTVLDYTLINDFSCPTITGTSFIFNKNYMLLSYVKECVEGNPGLTRIVILAQQTLFLDMDLDISTIFSTPLTIFAISPTWTIEGASNTLSLVGNTGALPVPLSLPGDDSAIGGKGSTGGNGSNFVAVYKEFPKLPTVPACGGVGGSGQGGAKGKAGGPGEKQKFSVDGDIIAESQCAAWANQNEKDGNIQVRLYPNTCNGQGGTADRCYAGNDGREVTVYGKSGSKGEIGGAGGTGGDGGIGGSVIFVNVSNRSPIEKVGNRGSNGSNGPKGADGKDGSQGADLTVVIDDVSHSGKRCKILEYCRSVKSNFSTLLEEQSIAYEEKKNENILKQVVREACVQNVDSSNTFDISPYKTYVTTYLTTTENSINLFVHNHMTDFTSKIRNHAYLK